MKLSDERPLLFFNTTTHIYFKESLLGQMVKNLLVMQKTQVCSLGWEDLLEKGMATLQHFCLENFMDRGAWWVTVHGITKNWTGLGN